MRIINIIGKAFFTFVRIFCYPFCYLLIFATGINYYAILTHHYQIPLTSLMLDKSKDFRTMRDSNISNYTYLCPFDSAPPRSQLEKNPFSVRPHNMVVQEVTHKYLEELSRDLEGKNIFINKIYIGSSPLEGSYQSSHIALREKVRRQWAGFDFHAFIAFMTSDNTHWALEKNKSGIYVSSVARRFECEGEPTTIILYFGTGVRAEPLTNLCFGYICNCYPHRRIGYPIKNLTLFLRKELDRRYSIFYDNCQSFAKRTFEEVIKDKIWDPLPLIYLFFDSTVEMCFDLVVVILILINNFLAWAHFMLVEVRKHIKFVCCAYIVWTTSTDISKVFPFLTPDFFVRIFLGIHFLLWSKLGEVLLLLKTLCIISTLSKFFCKSR